MLTVLATTSPIRSDQDYDEESYGPSPGGNSNSQADPDNYNGDEGYGSNQNPAYGQAVDSEGSNNNPNYSPQAGSGGNDNDGDYEGDDSSAAAAIEPSIRLIRQRRSVTSSSAGEPDNNKPAASLVAAESAPKLRTKRHGKYYIGPVYTYVKTDKHANFKWGVSTMTQSSKSCFVIH